MDTGIFQSLISESYLLLSLVDCLNLGFIAVKTCHDQGNSYKDKHFIGAGLQVQRFSPLSSRQEAWQRADRDGAGEEAESSTP